MGNLENRISALEGDCNRGGLSHLTDAALDAFIETNCAKLGTTLTAEVARYGSERAIVTELQSGQWDHDHNTRGRA